MKTRTKQHFYFLFSSYPTFFTPPSIYLEFPPPAIQPNGKEFDSTDPRPSERRKKRKKKQALRIFRPLRRVPGGSRRRYDFDRGTLVRLVPRTKRLAKVIPGTRQTASPINFATTERRNDKFVDF